MQIRWHGHSCFELRDGSSIVIDPHNGRGIGLPTPRVSAELVLVTHDHFDHNAVHIVAGNPKVIRERGEYIYNDVQITGYNAYHDTEHGAKRGKITMFKILVDGISILHTGDLGHILTHEMAEKIGTVNILLIPVGGKYTVDADGAMGNIKILKPNVVIPMHYKVPGLNVPIEPVNRFLNLFPPNQIMHVGKSIEVTRNDLPQKLTLWVFSL